MDSLGLIIVNTGSEPTFTGRGAESVIDITLASESLAGDINDWEVLSGSYNGSDHESISFRTGQPRTPQTFARPSIGWNTAGGIDPDAFRTGLLLAKWIHPTTIGVIHPDTAAAEFELLTTKAADFTLPAKAVFTNTAVHWWTAEISELRKKCNSTRRIIRRAPRQAGQQTDDDNRRQANALAAFRAARKALRVAIKKSKSRCWDELLYTVNSDPWGKPYKLVMRKLGGPSPT